MASLLCGRCLNGRFQPETGCSIACRDAAHPLEKGRVASGDERIIGATGLPLHLPNLTPLARYAQ